MKNKLLFDITVEHFLILLFTTSLIFTSYHAPHIISSSHFIILLTLFHINYIALLHCCGTRVPWFILILFDFTHFCAMQSLDECFKVLNRINTKRFRKVNTLHFFTIRSIWYSFQRIYFSLKPKDQLLKSKSWAPADWFVF